MRLRRFEATSVSQALAQVKRDLGPEAVILHARAVTAGAGSGAAGARVEVTAAVDEAALPEGHPAAWSGGDRGAGTGGDARGARRAARADGLRPPEPPPSLEDISGALEEIRHALHDLREEGARPVGVPTPLRHIYRHLVAHDVTPAVARRLLGGLAGSREARRGRVSEAERARAAAAGRFRVSGPIGPGRRQRRVALVGPTGVGKTTSIAKLAGQLGPAGHLRVALLTLDTYRIGAVAQLQIYADLLRVPLHVVRTPDEAGRALAAACEADLVLVDTMGRSPRGAEGIAAVGHVLGAIPDLEVHLAVSATTTRADLEEVLLRFRPLGYHHLLATKLDEARSAGPLLGLALERDLTVSYLSTGQEVPDDLEVATPRRLAHLLIPETRPARRRAGAHA